jgi:hypothetical protein
MKIENKLSQLISEPSDINELLPTLKKYAAQCEHITEMGTRYVVSSWALLAGMPKELVCYDILIGLDINIFNPRIEELKAAAHEASINFTFKQADVLSIDIVETDMLFIDTYHEYNQMKNELALHGNKARKFLAFHDTTTFGEKGETFKEPVTVGIWPAIEEFMLENPHWSIAEKLEFNNGLTVLKRNNE